MTTITRRSMLAASAAFAITPAFAQSGTMTLVVPFPPGGSTDALARLLQSHLQARLGRIVLVENKSGAAGALGAAQVAKSAPDGSSFLVTFDSHAVIPAILEKPPLDVEQDLLPVFLVGTAPYVVAAYPGTPYKTFADVIAASKAKPGSVKYASVGIGTLGHLAMTVLGNKAGMQMDNLLKVLQDGACSSKTMIDKGPKMLKSDFTPEGHVKTSLKDGRLALEQGARLGAPMLIGSLWTQLQQAAYNQGLADVDSSAFIEVLRGMAGLPKRG